MKNPQISIIVPVYNVEKYISECIESLLNQDYSNIEIILVDDGSVDSSGEICEQYAKKYEDIKVIHQENSGLSAARNTGITQATGDYLLYVDSDDYIEKNSISKIVAEMNSSEKEVDVVFLEAIKVFPNGTKISLGDGYCKAKINGKQKKEVIKHLAELPKFPASACTKMVRRDVILDNNLYFEKGLLSEDIDWTLSVIKYAEVFVYCDFPYYYYRQSRNDSITNSLSIKNAQDILYIIKKWSNKDTHNDFQVEFNSFMAYEYMIAIYVYSTLSNEDKKKIKNTFRENKWVMKYATQRKSKLTAILLNIVGIDVTARLLRLANRIRKGMMN